MRLLQIATANGASRQVSGTLPSDTYMRGLRPKHALVGEIDIGDLSRDEDRVLAQLRALRSDLIDRTIAVHHGRVVKRTGDGSPSNSAA